MKKIYPVDLILVKMWRVRREKLFVPARLACALINFNNDMRVSLEQGCVVSPCNIQQGESKQASRAFVTPTTLNVLPDYGHILSLSTCFSTAARHFVLPRLQPPG